MSGDDQEWRQALAQELSDWYARSGVTDAVPLSMEIGTDGEIMIRSASRGIVVIGRLSPAWRLLGVTEEALKQATEKLALPSRRSAEKRGKRPAQLRAEITRRRQRDDTNETIAADLGISESYLYRLMKNRATNS